jgi:hypothetical protein
VTENPPVGSDTPFGPGGPLAALSNLSSAFPAVRPAEPCAPQRLPELPRCVQPIDWVAASGAGGPRYLSERRAGRDEFLDELRRLNQLELALRAARDGRLHRDWREQGLAKAVVAVTEGHVGHDLWAWKKIAEGSRDVWEPKVFADYADAYSTLIKPGAPVWRMPLARWRLGLLTVKSLQEDRDRSAVSRWAGFNLVNAWMFNNKSAWNTVLDRHEGAWPATLRDYHKSWSESLRAHYLLEVLDGIELSYELGLAAGGEAIDWRENHTQRIQRWRMTGERERESARLERISPDSVMYQLPRTWLASGAV